MKEATEYAIGGMALLLIAEVVFSFGHNGFGLQGAILGIASMIPALVLLTQILIIATLAAYFLLKNNPIVKKALGALSQAGLELAFLVALTAMCGSLFYSEVMGYVPCELCWFQRIFMYPLSFLLAVALWKKRDDALQYVLPLTVIGSIFSIYQYQEQFLGFFASCASTCGEKTAAAFGYLTIPLMALTASVAIAGLLYLNRRKLAFN
jgi:disulfide bond formation protein DsbB